MTVVNTIATAVVVVLGLHIVTKFAFFALPYRRRRALLDKQYGGKASATTTSDVVLMAFTMAIAALLLWRGVDPVSFLGGLWVGATLIQLYFHRFHRPVAPERAAPPPTSPLKEVSYAIQDAPWRPWPQLLTLTALVLVSLAQLAWK
ncbi:hypothetical protein [Mycobacterium sp.]|uniref:hypothetical protein n=1 Tax=Mycobacterium sp. TaxID=1785 RepID=UPI002CF3D6F5|nr:hypothetical protein [Mycobacterium sp.]HTY34034.1 hypothetical protein [Mycobacterium sp.]